MILTIGSILLFGIFLSQANRLMIGNNQIASQNEYYITGLALAQSVLDEAKTKWFDQVTHDNPNTTVPRATLTNPTALKPETGEIIITPDTLTSASPYSATNKGYMSAVKYNDVDDYNGYSRIVNTPRAENYKVMVAVNYASETNPDTPSTTQTYCKRMVVKVTSPFFARRGKNDNTGGPDTLSISYAFTY